MSAIKDFFKKKKTEAKFKLAGGGHKLGETSAAPAPRKPAKQQERAHPSQSSQQAGAAALNRFAGQDQKDADFQKARQKALIKEKARKELEKEQKIEQEIAKIKEVYGEKEDVEVEGPSHLAAQGVYFVSELVGGEPASREVMKQRIKDFLYAQLEGEMGLTAVLIIHTCNSPRDRVELCVETLSKYIDNIVNNPAEPKFRKIRRSNKAFKERVAALEGTQEFLEGCGFQVRQMEGPDGQMEDFWVFPEENTDFESLAAMRDTLQGAEPVSAELDRGLIVIPPQQKMQRELPSDFFSISKEELKAEQTNKKEMLERESMLRTKAMREKEEAKARRKYKFCLIRIRFPDGWILQGTFGVNEPVSAVSEFVISCLETPLPSILSDSVTGARLGEGDYQATLLDLGFVPASLVNFCWDPEIEMDLASQGGAPQLYLREELKMGHI
eukprot:GFUD01030452.1.p1 GENE.GFUD01030452.1~~GFUD01030452.1.p1  ORF type:complete len:442 (+),score=157.19 GFUD01030452.1:613-1938(+)